MNRYIIRASSLNSKRKGSIQKFCFLSKAVLGHIWLFIITFNLNTIMYSIGLISLLSSYFILLLNFFWKSFKWRGKKEKTSCIKAWQKRAAKYAHFLVCLGYGANVVVPTRIFPGFTQHNNPFIASSSVKKVVIPFPVPWAYKGRGGDVYS